MTRQDPKQQPKGSTSPGASEPDVLRVIADVERHLSRLKEHHAGQGALLEELAQREMKIQASLAQVERDRHEIERRSTELDGAWAEADAMRKSVEHQRADIDEERRTLEHERKSLESAKKDIQAKRAEADAKLQEAGDILAARKEELDALRAELEQREDDLESRRAQLEAHAAELNARDASSADREAKLISERDEARSEANEARSEADRALASLGEMRGAKERAETRIAELEHAVGELAARADSAASSSTEAESELAEARASLLERDRQLAKALGELEQASSAAAASEETSSLVTKLQSRVAALESEVTSRDEQLEQAAREIVAARRAGQASADASDQIEQLRQEATEREAALRGELEEARRRLETARAEIDELRARPERSSGGKEHALRRRRLQRMRELLRERAHKLEHAGQVLGQRASESEKVMEIKARLEAQERVIAKRAERVAKGSAFKSVGVGLLCFGIILAAIAGASWTAAGSIAPATYAARATVQVDSRGGAVTTAQLAEWQKYHENLINDPQLMEIAADRMKRRGIASLASPVTLQRFLQSALTISSSNDGVLAFEMRGEGSSKTERILDTFVTALVSHANAGREHRVDGAATQVSVVAKAGAEPLEDQRTVYAAGMFAGGSMLCLLLGGVMWRRLVDSHRQQARAEAATAVDSFDAIPMPPIR